MRAGDFIHDKLSFLSPGVRQEIAEHVLTWTNDDMETLMHNVHRTAGDVGSFSTSQLIVLSRRLNSCGGGGLHTV